MSEHIVSRDVIRRQARAAVEAGKPASENPYLQGSISAKRWLAEYLTRELELKEETAGRALEDAA